MRRSQVCYLLLLLVPGVALSLESSDHREIIWSYVVEDNNTAAMNDEVKAYNPLDRQSYDGVIAGPVQRNSARRNREYSHWRYVTVYNKVQKEERITVLPALQEECYDDSYAFGSWRRTFNISVSLSSQLKARMIGLSAQVSTTLTQGASFSTQRRISATAGLSAIHTPYMGSTTYEGFTYILTYDQETKRYGYIANDRSRGYPYPFRLDNQELILKVEKEVLEVCED